MAAPSPSNPIPLDMMFDILVRLPVKSLLRFKCVCKDWCNLVNGLPFIQQHLNKSLEINQFNLHNHPFVFTQGNSLYFGDDLINSPSQYIKLNLPDNDHIIYDEQAFIQIIGSCNDLVFLKINDEGFAVCNPSTRTSKIVLPVEWKRYSCFVECGFGYDCEHDDYKIVWLIYEESDRGMWVYSLKADSWRRVSFQRQPPLEKKFYVPKCPCLFVNGMLHSVLRWFDDESDMCLHPKEFMEEENEPLQITRFNLTSEEWEENLDFPNIDPPTYFVVSSFIDGCFCLSFISRDSVDIWSMKEYGNKESRTKLFCVQWDSLSANILWLFPLISYWRTRSSEVFIFHSNKPAGVVWFDPKYETMELYEFGIPGFGGEIIIKICVGSLVSIPGGSQMRE